MTSLGISPSEDEEGAMGDCTICVEALNLSTRLPITCTKCDLVCCKSCFKRYISDPEHYLRCMSCQVEFDRTSLKSRLGLQFMRTTYRDIRESVLYDREKGLLPITQARIEDQLLIDQLKVERQGLAQKYNEIRKQRTIALKQLRYSKKEMAACDVIDQYLHLSSAVEVIDEQLQDEQAAITLSIEQLSHSERGKKKPKVTRTYILPCTKTGCKGMLSQENKDSRGYYICAICFSNTCSMCRVLIDQGDKHVCDPDMVKTIEFMDATSKPCPGCNVSIHKISGCSQMFCTVCLTSWNWNTRCINSGAIHNPHHAEWLRFNRNRPREIGDIQCGRELTMQLAVSMVQSFDRLVKHTFRNKRNQQAIEAADYSSYMFNAMRMSLHHHSETMPSLARNMASHNINEDLRINLLRGLSTELEFKREIQRKDKAASRRAELLNVVTTYRDALTDIIWPFADLPRHQTVSQWIDMVKELQALEIYINECFNKVFETFGSTASFAILSDRKLR